MIQLKFITINFWGCYTVETKHCEMDNSPKYSNHLIDESSPYLQQHAHNPVDWYPWGKEALQKAMRERKLLFISIGYAACHWCHVMERESFENEEVADILNKNFVSIKIDREQRPDLDQIYMNAIQLITGSGGWPLNCLALSDGRPFWGGTYFTADQLKEILSELGEEWPSKSDVFEETAKRLATEMDKHSIISSKSPISSIGMDVIHTMYANLERLFDLHKGGYRQRQKFPKPSDWQFIMKYASYTKNDSAMEQVNLTLTNMALGGIYDHVGGGFARYSTDENWKIPHFEKMLYDNAQLISLYCNAWKTSRNPLYSKVVYETMEFVIREMLSEEKGFYSSIDADSEGKEGAYYVWQASEIESILGKDAKLFEEYFNVNASGNWEDGKNVLFLNTSNKRIFNKYNLTESEFDEKIAMLRTRMLQARSMHTRPGTDDKILTSWNALMLSACIDAYRTFDEKQWLELALQNAQFLKNNLLRSDHSLYRSYKQNKAEINGFLDDYAFCTMAFIDLYQVTFDEGWLKLAKDLVNYAIDHFIDPQSGLFFYSVDLPEGNLSRKMELFDNVIPSSNSVMAHCLFMLGTYYDDVNYVNISSQMIASIRADIEQHSVYSANWFSLLLWMLHQPKELVITGEKSIEYRQTIDHYYFPNIIIAGSKGKSDLPLLKNRYNPLQTLTYICVNKRCRLPLENVNEVIEQLVSNGDH